MFLERNGRRVNAKSIMGVMMLAAGLGSEIELEVTGADEQAAIDAIVACSRTSSAKAIAAPAVLKEDSRDRHLSLLA